MDLRLEVSGSGLARTGEDPLEEPAAETLRLTTVEALVEQVQEGGNRPTSRIPRHLPRDELGTVDELGEVCVRVVG